MILHTAKAGSEMQRIGIELCRAGASNAIKQCSVAACSHKSISLDSAYGESRQRDAAHRNRAVQGGEYSEDGSHLSGGQRQRIALARALARGVKVLILDEGVSAIDVPTANEIESELLGMKDLTLLTVTHRIRDGLIGQYDRIVMMKEGTAFSQSAPADLRAP